MGCVDDHLDKRKRLTNLSEWPWLPTECNKAGSISSHIFPHLPLSCWSLFHWWLYRMGTSRFLWIWKIGLWRVVLLAVCNQGCRNCTLSWIHGHVFLLISSIQLFSLKPLKSIKHFRGITCAKLKPHYRCRILILLFGLHQNMIRFFPKVTLRVSKDFPLVSLLC